MTFLLFFLFQFICFIKAIIEKKIYLLNNFDEDNLSNNKDNVLFLNESFEPNIDYLLKGNGSKIFLGSTSKDFTYIFFQIKLCENTNLYYDIFYNNSDGNRTINKSYSKNFNVEPIKVDNDKFINYIGFDNVESEFLFRYNFIQDNLTEITEDFSLYINVINKYIYIEFYPLEYDKIIDYKIILGKNITNECELHQIPDFSNIKIFNFSLSTNKDTLIIKLDEIILESSNYSIHIIASLNNITFSYELTTFNYEIIPYEIKNKLYYFEDEDKIIFKTTSNKTYFIQWNDISAKSIQIYKTTDNIIFNSSYAQDTFFLTILQNENYYIIYHSKLETKYIYFDLLDEKGKYIDEEEGSYFMLHGNSNLSFYGNIEKFKKEDNIILFVYMNNIHNLTIFNYSLYNENNNVILTDIPKRIDENNTKENEYMFYLIVKKSIESQFIQINLNVECIENNFETNKTVYIKYLNYIEIKNRISVKKNNMNIPIFYKINRTYDDYDKNLIFYTKYENTFQIYYGDYITDEGTINVNMINQMIQIFNYSDDLSKNIITIKVLIREENEKSFEIIDKFNTALNLHYINSKKRENFIKNYKCINDLLILNIYEENSNDKILFFKNINKFEIHYSNNFSNYEDIESIFKSRDNIVEKIVELKNNIDLIYINCSYSNNEPNYNNKSIILYQLNLTNTNIENVESSSFFYLFLGNNSNSSISFNENLENKKIQLKLFLEDSKDSSVDIFLKDELVFKLNNENITYNFSFTVKSETKLIFNNKDNASLINIQVGLIDELYDVLNNTKYYKEVNDKIILIYDKNQPSIEVRVSIKTKNKNTEICFNQDDEADLPFLYFSKENCEEILPYSYKSLNMKYKENNKIQYISLITSDKVDLNYTYVQTINTGEENVTKINYTGISQINFKMKQKYLFYQVTLCSDPQEVKINSNHNFFSERNNYGLINNEENKTNLFEFTQGNCIFHYAQIENEIKIKNIESKSLNVEVKTDNKSNIFNITFKNLENIFNVKDFEYYIIMTNNISLFNLSNTCLIYDIINDTNKYKDNKYLKIFDEKYPKEYYSIEPGLYNSSIKTTVVAKQKKEPYILIYYNINETFSYEYPIDSWFFGAMFMTLISILFLIIFICINYKRNQNEKRKSFDDKDSEELEKNINLVNIE